jgi:predicted dehydrogenase
LNKKFSFGFIGCGEIAAAAAKAIKDSQLTEIGYAMDVVEALAQDFKEKYGSPATTDVDALLASEVDGVYIATPHYLHAPLAIRAAKAKKHIIVEKPIATTLRDADAMIAAAKENGVTLSVAFIIRYRGNTVYAKRLLEAGLIGEIMGTKITYIGAKKPSYWTGGFTGRAKTDWRKSKSKAGGGVLIMNMVHNIDTIRFVTGLETARVYSEYGTFVTPVEVEDFLTAAIRYTSGAIGSIFAGSAFTGRTDQGERHPDRILGKEGQILLSSPLRLFTKKAAPAGSLWENSPEIVPEKWQEIDAGPKTDARQLMMEDFVRAVKAGKEPPITGEAGRAALEVILAAYKSGEEGRPVNLPLR